jgi:hypothetical protein
VQIAQSRRLVLSVSPENETEMTTTQRPFVISLTTTPPRIDKIAPTLRDLLNQTAKPIEVRLNLCRNYRRFPGEQVSTDSLPEGITVRWQDEDFGPATKVLPALRDYQGQDIDILFCDDDQKYERDWAAKFLAARQEHPDKCLVGKGYDLDDRPVGHRYLRDFENLPRAKRREKGRIYRLARAASLLAYKPQPYVESGYVDILEGYRGVMVRPSFFDEQVFDIPDILWTVDDPWLSGHLTRRGVPIWLVQPASILKSPYGAHYTHRLGKFVYRDHGRLAADNACIEYFRNNYGIWPGQHEAPRADYKRPIFHWLYPPEPILIEQGGKTGS